MSTSELKLNLHRLIDTINDPSVLNAVYALLRNNATETEDWWDELTESQKASIMIGLKEAEEGKVVPHDEVMRQVRHLLKKHE